MSDDGVRLWHITRVSQTVTNVSGTSAVPYDTMVNRTQNTIHKLMIGNTERQIVFIVEMVNNSGFRAIFKPLPLLFSFLFYVY